MNWISVYKQGRQRRVGLMIGAVICAASVLCVMGADTNAPVAKTAEKKMLTGAELYSMHCNRCHPERYPTERTAAQWKTILLHMRVRANLPAEQARTILKYLQENSGR